MTFGREMLGVTKREMPAGVRGFISFHVRPEGVHFKIDRGSPKRKK